MRGSVQIGKFWEIPVQLHWSFGLILLGIGYVSYRYQLDGVSLLLFVLLVGVLFVCVLLHEFGHALMARRFGVRTRDIILSPIGGVARLERLPEKPIQEFYIAIAGPLVNVGIIALIAPYFLFVSAETALQIRSILYHYFGVQDNVFTENTPPLALFLFNVLALNGTLVVFNLLPAFPMDGGRVLRALLATRLNRVVATRIAVYIGQLLAIGLIGYGSGIWWGDFSPTVIFIGVFVFITAASEYRMVRMEKMLDNYRAADVLRVQFTRLQTDDLMQTAAAHLRGGLEKNFLVFDANEQLQGILVEEDMVKAMQAQALEQPIALFVRTDYETIRLEDSLKMVFSKMQWQPYDLSPVMDATGQVLGVVDTEKLQDFLHIQQKIHGKRNK
jgi:Zn-dependent protease